MTIHATLETWTGSALSTTTLGVTSLDGVYTAIASLDGKTKDLLSLVADSGPQLVIGGGASKFVVTFALSDEELWTAETGSRRDGQHVLQIGGQDGDYPAEIVCTQGEAELAAKQFLEDYTRAPGLTWRQE